jgi:hypothetical protein
LTILATFGGYAKPGTQAAALCWGCGALRVKFSREVERRALLIIAGTREKALLSAVFNFARGEGMTNASNPCAGVRGAKPNRNVYVHDATFAAVWEAADVMTRDAMDLALLTGQRPGDTTAFRETDIRDGHLVLTGIEIRRILRIRGNRARSRLHRRLRISFLQAAFRSFNHLCPHRRRTHFMRSRRQ